MKNLNFIKKSSLLIFILILSILLLEILLKIYSNFNEVFIINDNKNSKLFKVYDEGMIFKNYGNFYKYNENLRDIRYLNFFYNKDKLIKIWDYNFSTNNYGLVQDNNIYKDIKSILFLGDSFTEGQGSESWINYFDGFFNEFQIINGGFQGTGFQQFENFEKHISNEMEINHVFVLYIGGDLRRGIINIKNSECIKNFQNCSSENSHFGLPNDQSFDIKNNILKLLDNKKKLKLKTKIKFLIRDTYIYSYSRTIINTFRLKDNKTINKNLEAIINLKKKYKENIHFIRINTAEEIAMKNISYETKQIKNFLEKNDIKNYFCDLDNNIELFHKYDYHLNKRGYKKLYKCVNNILSNLIF